MTAGRWRVNSWAGALLPLAVVFIGVCGVVMFLWLHWQVKGGDRLDRIYLHCLNFATGVCIGAGIIVCIIGFLWDIGVLNAGF